MTAFFDCVLITAQNLIFLQRYQVITMFRVNLPFHTLAKN